MAIHDAVAPEGASPAPVRSWRERAIQTVAYEVGGMLAITPLWVLVTGSSASDSLLLLVCLSATVMVWMAIYNTVFDIIEARTTRRVASQRPQRWRLIHAVGLEATSVLTTTPVVVLVTGYGWLEALFADIALGVAYAGYAYLFHLCFDWMRPVVRPAPETGQAR